MNVSQAEPPATDAVIDLTEIEQAMVDEAIATSLGQVPESASFSSVPELVYPI